MTRPSQGINHLRDLAGRRLSVPKEAGNFSPAQVRSLRAWDAVLAFAGVASQDIEFAPVVADHPSVPFGDVARREVEALLSGQTNLAGIEVAKTISSAGLKITPDVLVSGGGDENGNTNVFGAFIAQMLAERNHSNGSTPPANS